jgi:hypothetical protein
MPSGLPDLEELLSLQPLLMGQMSQVAPSDGAFAKRLGKVDPIRAAATFGALLSVGKPTCMSWRSKSGASATWGM